MRAVRSASARAQGYGDKGQLSYREQFADLLTTGAVVILLYGAFTPVGWLLRLLGRDALHLAMRPDTPTYWIVRRPPGPAAHTMTDEF